MDGWQDDCHGVWCIGRGPHLQLRQEAQGSSDFSHGGWKMNGVNDIRERQREEEKGKEGHVNREREMGKKGRDRKIKQGC